MAGAWTAVGLFLAGTSLASAHDALLDRALARIAFPASNLTGTLQTTMTMTGGKEPEVDHEKVDLRTSPNKALMSYAELGAVIGQDTHVVSRDAGRTVYAFTTRRLPQGDFGTGKVQIDDDDNGPGELFDGTAEISLDAYGRPFVSHLELSLHKHAGKLIARVKRIDVGYTFVPAPGSNAMLATAASVDVDLRVLFFMHRHAHGDSVLSLANAGQ